MERFIEFVSETPPFAWLLIALVAVVAYRFIPEAKRMPIYFGATVKHEQDSDVTVQVRQFMIVTVSIVVLAASLYIILSRAYDESAQKWAYGAVGLVTGHWLKK